MRIRITLTIFALLLMTISISAQDTTEAQADLDAVKQFALDNGAEMYTATQAYLATTQAYYDIIASHDFDYEAAWTADGEELATLIADARVQWLEASLYYETNEGIIAGVPSLAYYDVWIDAGSPASEDPENALDWQLELPNGEILESPGNFFHNLTEPALYGTHPDFIGLAVDLDGDGTMTVTEMLPEANIFLGAAQGLDSATAEMNEAVSAWEPTIEDAFTAMVVMVPTMSEYFEQWKESAFIAGETSESQSFIAVSRLFDINGILTGLDITYDRVGPVVAEVDAELHAQIDIGYSNLLKYVGNLYQQEQDGVVFTAEEADFFGTEAQRQAENLAALLAQAADELGLELSLE